MNTKEKGKRLTKMCEETEAFSLELVESRRYGRSMDVVLCRSVAAVGRRRSVATAIRTLLSSLLLQ